MADAKALDRIFAAPLRGEVSAWPSNWKSHDRLEAACHRLMFHGIAGLLHSRGHLLIGWPNEILANLREETVACAMWELRHKELVVDVIEGLHAAGITSVLLKGTALAYSLYDNPAHRIRGDSDLLICFDRLAEARNVLEGFGWYRPYGAPGPFGPMHYEELWQFRDPAGLTHDLDLHWEVTNSKALGRALQTEQVIARSIPLPGLSSHARCADQVSALLLSSINRAVHATIGYWSHGSFVHDPDRLQWAFDIYLQSANLPPEQQLQFAERSLDSGLASTCLDAIRFSQSMIAPALRSDVVGRLEGNCNESAVSPYLSGGSMFARGLADFQSTSGLREKLAFVLARAFPSLEHMRRKYPESVAAPLAWLYAKRVWIGFTKLLRNS